MDNVLWVIFFIEIVIKLISEGAKVRSTAVGASHWRCHPLLKFPSLQPRLSPLLQPWKILVGNPDKFWNAIDIAVVIFSNPYLDVTRSGGRGPCVY